VKHEKKNDKGKERMKDVKPKEEVTVTRRPRKPPQSTGVVRQPPCTRCVKRKTTCYKQRGGNACVSCAKVKLRCDDFKGDVQQEEEVEKTKRADKTRKAPIKPEPSGMQDKRRALKGDIEMVDRKDDDDESLVETSSLQSSPVPKRRRLSEKSEGKRYDPAERKKADRRLSEKAEGKRADPAERKKADRRLWEEAEGKEAERPDRKKADKAEHKKAEAKKERPFLGILEHGNSKSERTLRIYF
jgi:hypothetical protein